MKRPGIKNGNIRRKRRGQGNKLSDNYEIMLEINRPELKARRHA